jgi:hypothetical protein
VICENVRRQWLCQEPPPHLITYEPRVGLSCSHCWSVPYGGAGYARRGCVGKWFFEKNEAAQESDLVRWLTLAAIFDRSRNLCDFPQGFRRIAPLEL